MDKRTHLGFISVSVGFGIVIVSGAAAAMQVGGAPPIVVGQGGWTAWLQNTANVLKLVEASAFLFGAYQFWASRNERRNADAEAAERSRRDANYQAWQVINSAQGKGGSGGRIEALADLVRCDISLAGIRLDDAWLEGVDLRRATMPHASFERTVLQGAKLDGANLKGASFREATLTASSLVGANLRGADFTGARVSAANLRGADLTDAIGLRELRSISHANIEAVSAPRGFRDWALEHGAVDESAPAQEDENNFSRDFRAV